MKNFYKGFDLISETDIPDANGKGLYLYHKKTGLEVFHILNSDEENLFGFCFRTPVKNSMGCAHIMEHSVLCGSEKFPLKEPFTNLCNQSLKTFLNAMTYPDKTVYPASTMDKTDYFNLMDVYGDAVFFPLLSENTFMQEGHRIEKNDDGTYSIQGVVYNEMKGNYSAFSGASYRAVNKALLKGSCYAESSGGDPLCIPDFTYTQFREFHDRYYSPSNCFLFLYGNIPTEEQLDFIQEKFLDRLEKKYPVPQIPSVLPFLPKEIEEMEKSEPVTQMLTVRATGPDSDADGCTVTVAWKNSDCHSLDYIMEASYVFNFLFGNDSSPLRKALLESKLGKRLAGTGSANYEAITGFGLTGVKEEDAGKVKDVIFDTLNSLADGDVLQKDIDATVLACDFANREITRNWGPFALTLLDRAADAWHYGNNPGEFLLYRKGFEKIKQALKEDSRYTQKLIRKHLLDNRQCAFVTVVPDKSFLEERNRKEQELIAQLTKDIDEEKLKSQLEQLHEYQEHKETEEESSCIPNIKPENLEPKANEYPTEVTSLKANDGSEVPLFINRENTNGIVYFDLFTPLDTLSLEDYKYISLFNSVLLDTGWNGKRWDKCIGEASNVCGDFYTEMIYQSSGVGENAQKYLDSIKDKNYANRFYLNFSMKMTVEKAKEALKLFAEAYNYLDFDDEERIKMLIAQAVNGKKASLIQYGTWYCSMRAACTKTKENAMDEILKGLRQIFTLLEIEKMPVKELCDKFKTFFTEIKKAGNVLHVTTDDESLKQFMPSLECFVKETNVHSVQPVKEKSAEELYECTILPGEDKIENEEYFVLPTQSGFSAACVKFDSMNVRESACGTVLSHWLSQSLLWDKIRTRGGAYGANSSVSGLDYTFDLNSFRDPTPLKSLQIFKECIEESCSLNLSKEDIERAITGCYSGQKQPSAPETKGFIGFKNMLYGILQESCDEFIKEILKADNEGLRQFAQKIKTAERTLRTAVICDDKTEINSGKKINISFQ